MVFEQSLFGRGLYMLYADIVYRDHDVNVRSNINIPPAITVHVYTF